MFFEDDSSRGLNSSGDRLQIDSQDAFNRSRRLSLQTGRQMRLRPRLEFIFEKHDYELLRRRTEIPGIEKQGTFMNGLFYGDWYSGGVLGARQEYTISIWEPARRYWICDAYMVQEHDDPFFQSERKPYKSRRHVYQKILEK